MLSVYKTGLKKLSKAGITKKSQRTTRSLPLFRGRYYLAALLRLCQCILDDHFLCHHTTRFPGGSKSLLAQRRTRLRDLLVKRSLDARSRRPNESCSVAHGLRGSPELDGFPR